ncbi:glucose-1-phosphate adenylyltransferase [Piscinibacter sakaiensis]|uniref:Glucose-1-phosphate adenylyltransferase n=1 Tax=Piscinibacter sakaiensis TaxID=1547922 RepID=A0A0K8P2L7_PISS1|nr:glucose-1-phosphate adenylyltransferase [Piscinibacter sakaiensis]
MRRHAPEVLAFVMAGGEGTRLHPLTADRCKPSVPFNGKHRIVDFVLSNLVNSEIYSVYLLVQYKSQALIEHVRDAWSMAHCIPRHFVTVVPPQMRNGKEWFQGTADAVAQNLHLIESHRPDLVVVFGADHVYRMDVRQMIDAHLARGADVSIATLPVPAQQSTAFGVVETDDDLWVRGFQEKPAPAQAHRMPGQGDRVLASMGNYVFSTDVLLRVLRRAVDAGERDFGKDILPRLARSHRVLAYDFATNRIPGVGAHEEPAYWRDVGTIDAYYDAHFDTVGAQARFRMNNPQWPIYASPDASESAQIVGGDIRASVLGSGCLVDGASLDHALLRRAVRVEPDARIADSIVMDRTVIGRGARITRAIIDQDNRIPPGEVIGGDPVRDRQRFHVSDSGIVVVPRRYFAPLAAG